MIGNLYNWVSSTIVGTVPLEFEFIKSFLTAFIFLVIVFIAISPIVILKDLFN